MSLGLATHHLWAGAGWGRSVRHAASTWYSLVAVRDASRSRHDRIGDVLIASHVNTRNLIR